MSSGTETLSPSFLSPALGTAADVRGARRKCLFQENTTQSLKEIYNQLQ